MKKSIVIALPTFNEEESIVEVIEAIRLLNIPVFIVDNRSTDSTVEKARALGIEVFQRDEYGTGYGCGIQKAMQVADQKGYSYMGMVDCDSTYPIASFSTLIANANGRDLVVGARNMMHIEFWHRMANYIHSITASILFQRKVLDINSGMRIIRIAKFRGALNAYNMGMVAQMSSFAYRNDLNVREIEISYGKRKGESKIRIWDGAIILYHIFSERIKKKV